MARKVTAGHMAMRASEHGSFDHEAHARRKPWELAALDRDGNELYRTEYFESEADAKQEARMLNEGELPDRLDNEVVYFKAVKREELTE